MGIVLTEQCILKHLGDALEQLKEGRLDQAETVLSSLEFDRLVGSSRSDAWQGNSIHPSLVFGRSRVLETANLIRKCRRLIARRDTASALAIADAAVSRWKGPKGD